MDLTAGLRRHFGHSDFRAGQREACEAAVAGRDVLVVMPTGSGKSLCYQLPALLRDDLTIVVSPLVALMQDQADALAAAGAGDRVAVVNSQRDPAANRAAVERAAAGELRLLYVAPERFGAPGFLERVAAMRVGIFVVDEAHCVSQWGHDFRPDYLRLAGCARTVGARSIMAATATATPRVAADVVRRLGLRDPVRIATGFDRPNVAYSVARPAGHEKLPMLVAALGEPDALPAIVYAGTRAGSEEVAALLGSELGIEAAPYHAGLERERRSATQARFLCDEYPVVVATNAFGMGVDKPNVRTVAHVTVPPSLEAYYQEAGRAGRDGGPARAILLADPRDKALHVHFIRRDAPDDRRPAALSRLLAAASGGDRYELPAPTVAAELGCGEDALRACLGHLARAGVVEPEPAPADVVAGRILRPFDRRAAALCRAGAVEGVRSRWRQYREVWSYVEGDGCRRRALLRHFGDGRAPEAVGGCCDACDRSLRLTAPAPRPEEIAELDDAILSVVRSARPRVGRTTCAEILHGARTGKIERNAYDGLPAYGSSAALARRRILARIDELIAAGRLETTGGRYPTLAEPAHAPV